MIPSRLYVNVPGLSAPMAREASLLAVKETRRIMPKLTGASAARLIPLWGVGFYGIAWLDEYVWYQEAGAKAFTMRSLAGKTIPMWIDDPTGIEARRNPKARRRTTASGKNQILIFRRAAPIGARKTIMRNGQRVEVPQSYPGAPGRIDRRQARRPFTDFGRVAGQIAPGNVGVRWRHRGLMRRQFLHQGIVVAGEKVGLRLTFNDVLAA